MKLSAGLLGLHAAMLFAVSLNPTTAFAHPHVWVTVETKVLYDDQNAITGFRHKWTFDEGYSSFAIMGLDKNQDGEYDRQELQELAEVNVTSLKHFGYFTFPKLLETKLEPLPPRDYWLEHEGATLTLFMTLPLRDPVPMEKVESFSFAIYDPTFYVDFAFAQKNPVRLSAAPVGCSPVIKGPNPGTAFGGVGGLSSLSESFFDQFDATSTIAEQYAKSISIACSAS